MKETVPATLAHPEWAPEGRSRIAWARAHMPVLTRIEEQLRQEQPFAGHRIAICLHLEAKTAVLAQVLKTGGAHVAITGSNPLSTQDAVAAALAESGIEVHARYGASEQEYDRYLERVLAIRPTLLIDDGGDLVARLQGPLRPLGQDLLGGAEETTTGIHRLKALATEGALAFPMIAVNDAHMKYLFDNRYGTGQSTWDGIMRTTNLVVAGKTVVVVGYGWCGKGVAMRARGLGARVLVTEVDPISANEALLDGFAVLPMAQAAPQGDIFVTVTGNTHVIRQEHFLVMKEGALLANAGHFDVEVDVAGLNALAASVREARQNIMGYTLPNGRTLYLLAEGRLVNLAAGDGHPVEIMDLTFALQALSLRYVVGQRLSPGLYPVPAAIDREVARIRLEAIGVEIDELTEEQKRYLASWELS